MTGPKRMCQACGERPVGGSKSGRRCAWCAEYGAPLRFLDSVIRTDDDGSIVIEADRNSPREPKQDPRIETAHEYLDARRDLVRRAEDRDSGVEDLRIEVEDLRAEVARLRQRPDVSPEDAARVTCVVAVRDPAAARRVYYALRAIAKGGGK